MNGVVHQAGPVHPVHGRRIRLVLQRIGLDACSKIRGRWFGITVDEQASARHPVGIGRRMGDEVVLTVDVCDLAVGDLRQWSVVVRAEDQVLSALTAVRARRAHVGDELERGVVDRARAATRWHLDDDWAGFLEIEHAERVHRVGVSRQVQTVGVHEVVEDHPVLFGLSSRELLRGTKANCFKAGDRHHVDEQRYRSVEIHFAVRRGDRRRHGHAVAELQGDAVDGCIIVCIEIRGDLRVVVRARHDISLLGLTGRCACSHRGRGRQSWIDGETKSPNMSHGRARVRDSHFPSLLHDGPCA